MHLGATLRSGKELIRIAAEIRHSKETQSELGKRFGLDRRWISRLKFIAKADIETRHILAKKSQSAIKRIVDSVRSKTFGRTLATKLKKLSQVVRSISIYNIGTKNSVKVERARLALADEKHENRRLKEESKELQTQLSTLKEKFSKVRKAAVYYKTNFENAVRGVRKQPSEPDPNLLHVVDSLRSKFGVRVNITDTRIEFECMSLSLRNDFIDRLQTS